jgi:hypothetical protein
MPEGVCSPGPTRTAVWGIPSCAPRREHRTAVCTEDSRRNGASIPPRVGLGRSYRVASVAHQLDHMHDRAVDSEEIAFSVDGWPPAKNEAKSMLAAGHTHSDRVLKLLAAAKAATRSQHSPVFGSDAVGLELIVHSPMEPPADATNFLGGVGDVLEAKDQRGVLDHLGDMANIALYANDRQIQAVTYRWSSASDTGYLVRVWRL